MDAANFELQYRPWKIILAIGDDEDMREQLEKKGFVVSEDKPRAHLDLQLLRAHKGLLYYDSCADEELLRFVNNRAVSTASISRHAMIAALEEADENRTFARFVDLPLELRARVFALHFKWAARMDRTYSHEFPPILRTSSTIYKEVLPLFNRTVAYGIQITSLKSDKTGRPKGLQRTSIDHAHRRFHPGEASWVNFKNGTAKSRLFRIVCPLYHNTYHFEITLYNCPKEGVYKITTYFAEGWKLGNRREELYKLVSTEMTDFATVLFKRIGKGPWDEAGFDELCAKLDVIVAHAQAIVSSSKG